MNAVKGDKSMKIKKNRLLIIAILTIVIIFMTTVSIDFAESRDIKLNNSDSID